jgi:predicted O-methyltransferase YrrM
MNEKQDYLPEIRGISQNIRLGRSVYEGYQRGWGLQFGNLLEEVKNDPLYQKAFSLIQGRSVQSELNRVNIFLIIKFYLKKIDFGHIIEFGSYKGGSAIFMAYLASILYPGMKVYALDTFQGMPETDKSIDAHSKGDFQNVDLDELKSYIKTLGLDNLELIQGRFEATTIATLERAKNISLAHIDCDIYSGVHYSYSAIKKYMVNGGYVVLDDPLYSSCIGAQEAVEKYFIQKDGLYSEQIYPQYVFRYPPLS